jgi:integrase
MEMGSAMGYSKKRIGKDGKPRYTACYLDMRGNLHSAGTFTNKKKSDKAWQREEAKIAEGRMGDPRRGRQTFEHYVTEVWLPNHVMEASTREGYSYQIDRHIMSWFGGMKMVEIMPSDVREWVTHLSGLRVMRKDADGKEVEEPALSPATIRNLKNILSAVFTTALNDQVIFLHPCKGVKTAPVPGKPPVIISPEQFDKIYQALEDDDFKLLIEVDIESGLRWGELTELRAIDIDLSTRILTVSRAVVQVNPKFHPTGKRFLVKEYPKDKEYRRFKLGAAITAKIKEHIQAKGIGPDGLLFEMRVTPVPEPSPGLAVAVAAKDLGYVDGTKSKHGSLSGYAGRGKCRCEHCRRAYADYRRDRRHEDGKDRPVTGRLRVVDTDGHIPRDWFRMQVWKPALEAAKLDVAVPTKYLRHAHASWLLRGGADLQVVKERMGHAKISTTERYLGTLPDIDETAVSALDKIRNRGRSDGTNQRRGLSA